MNIFSSIPLKLYSQKGRIERAKTIFELISKKYPNNKLASVALQKTNRMLNLSDGHNSFHQKSRENKKLNKEEISNRKLHLNSTPQVLEIGTTSVCNTIPPCVQCPKHNDPKLGYINNDAYHIPKSYIKRLQPFARRSVSVSLHGVGEPLTCSYLFDVLKYIRDNNTRVNFSTNGLLLTERKVEEILLRKVTFVNFSLDAATAKTYKKIRHHDFEKVINNIKNLISERDKRGLKKPRIFINMTLMRANVKEIPDFIKLAKQLNADVQFFHLIKGPSYKFNWFDYESQHCDNDPKTHDLYVERGFKLAKKLGVKIVFTGKRNLLDDDSIIMHNSIEVDKNTFFCESPWNHLLIDTDGSVYNCCWQVTPLGNLKESSIWEIWNGKVIKEIRESTAQGVHHPICNHGGSMCAFVLAFASSNKQVITSGDYKKQ